MNAPRNTDWRRASRRLVVAIILGVGVMFAVTPAANAAVTASFIPGTGTLSVNGDARTTRSSSAAMRQESSSSTVGRSPCSAARRRSPTRR